jgi:4-hydroxy-tetrahydrodipicolinate reductase
MPLVIGTTGFSKIQFDEIKRYSKELPVLLSSNMSIGVNLIASYAALLAQKLGDSYDIEILEMHHRNKKDLPSGTALYLASSIASGLKKNLTDIMIEKRMENRPKGKIGISSLRGGDVVGDHSVIFAGEGERIELIHKASDRAIFAKGALEAARWIIGKGPGLYSMIDVLGLK